MLARNAAIGVVFGVIGAAAAQWYQCVRGARVDRNRAKVRRRARRKRRKLERMAKDQPSDEDDSEDEELEIKAKSPAAATKRSGRSPASRTTSPYSSSWSSTDDSEDEELEIKLKSPAATKRSGRSPASRTTSPYSSTLDSSSSDQNVDLRTPVKQVRMATLDALSPGKRAKLEDKRTLLEGLVREKEAKLGKNHPQTLMSKWSFADLLQSGYGDIETACVLVKECVAAAKRNPSQAMDAEMYEAHLREWESLRRKVQNGEVEHRQWSPTRGRCWVRSKGAVSDDED